MRRCCERPHRGPLAGKPASDPRRAAPGPDDPGAGGKAGNAGRALADAGGPRLGAGLCRRPALPQDPRRPFAQCLLSRPGGLPPRRVAHLSPPAPRQRRNALCAHRPAGSHRHGVGYGGCTVGGILRRRSPILSGAPGSGGAHQVRHACGAGAGHLAGQPAGRPPAGHVERGADRQTGSPPCGLGQPQRPQVDACLSGGGALL